MTLVMYDSIHLDQFAGLTMDAAAGYVDGKWQTFPELENHVPPGTILLSITVFGGIAECVDQEPGNIEPVPAADWVVGNLAAGVWRPVVYTSASNAQNMIGLLAQRGVARNQFRLWSAHYNFLPHICAPNGCGFPAADGTQWTDRAQGRNLDQSELLDSFFQYPKTDEGINPMIAAFVNPFNSNTETFEINDAGNLYLRSRNSATGAWSNARQLGSGFTGSPSYAIRTNGIDVFIELKQGGVVAYVFDPAHPGWTRQSLTVGVP